MPEYAGGSSRADDNDVTNVSETNDQGFNHAAAEKHTAAAATTQLVPTVPSFQDASDQASTSDVQRQQDQDATQLSAVLTSALAAAEDAVHAPSRLPVSTAAVHSDANTSHGSFTRGSQLHTQQPGAIIEAAELSQPNQNHIAITVQDKPAAEVTATGSLALQRSSTNLSAASQSSIRECRICLSSDSQDDLVQPCSCTGSVKYAHMECLKAWVHERCNLQCELCGKQYRDEVKPQLEPLVAGRRPRRGRSRTVRVVNADGATVLSVEAADGDEDDDEDTRPQISWTRFWIHLGILVVLLVAVLYLALFVNVGASDNFWLMFLWRAITVILPLFLIIRCVAALYAWRQQYVASQRHR